MSTIEEFLKKDIAFKDDFVKTASGDLDVIAGLSNLKDALFRCLITTPGTVIHRLEYGVGIKDFQNSLNSSASQKQLTTRIQEQFEKDFRVERVIGVSVDHKDKTPDLVEVKIRIKVVGYGETLFSFTPFGDV